MKKLAGAASPLFADFACVKQTYIITIHCCVLAIFVSLNCILFM